MTDAPNEDHGGGYGGPDPIWLGIGMVLLIALVAAVLALVVDSDDETTADDWADDVCGALVDWRATLTERFEALADEVVDEPGPARAALGTALDDVGTATEELVDELEGVGIPETERGQAAADEVADAATALADVWREVADRLQEGSLLELVGELPELRDIVADGLAEAAASLERAAELDPAGELVDALRDSEACAELAGD